MGIGLILAQNYTILTLNLTRYTNLVKLCIDQFLI